MPGTHYDNDHSFIEALPFDYKNRAYLIIRSDSLEQMLINFNSEDSPVFDDLHKDTRDVNLIKRTISACLVAKISSFEPTLFINEQQYKFLMSTLLYHLQFLLALNNKQYPTLSSLYPFLKIKHEHTYQWILKIKAIFEKKEVHFD